jgi:hypothetical protein
MLDRRTPAANPELDEPSAPSGPAEQNADAGAALTPKEGLYEVPQPKFATPYGWVIGKHSVYEIVEDKKTKEERLAPRLPAPVWLDGLVASADDPARGVRVAALYGGRIIRTTISRTDMRTARRALEVLSHAGFPIQDASKWDWIRYLSAAEDSNQRTLEMSTTAATNGWRGDDESYPESFVLGDRIVHRDGSVAAIEPFAGHAAEPGEVRQYRAKGSEAEWQQALAVASQYRFLTLAICASGASVLLQPLRAEQGALIEVTADSGLGKTIFLKLALSVWGANGKRDIVTANSTSVGLETLQNWRRHLPLAIDELKQATGRMDPTQTIFLLTNGRGRTRGQPSMTAREALWYQNYVFLSGETSVLKMGDVSDNGPQARTFSITHEGGPFERDDNGREARWLSEVVSDNFGFAGRRLIMQLVTNDEQGWDALRAERRAQEARIAALGRQIAPGRQIARFVERRAGLFAPVYVAGRLLAELYPHEFPWERVQQNLDDAWRFLCESTADGFDRSEAALARIREWISASGHLFSSIRAGIPGTVEQIGREYVYEVGGPDGGTERGVGTAVVKSALDRHLRGHGFNSSDDYTRDWLRRGLILSDSRGRPGRNVRITGPGVWCIVFTGDAFTPREDSDAARSDEDDAPPPNEPAGSDEPPSVQSALPF